MATGTYHDEDSGSYYVQGTWASSNEYHVAYWLEKWGHAEHYIFQYNLLGDAERGSIKVDFVLWNTNKCMMMTPIEIDVEHWHQDEYSGEATFRRAMIMQVFGMEPISLTDEQTNTLEAAKQTVRKELL